MKKLFVLLLIFTLASCASFKKSSLEGKQPVYIFAAADRITGPGNHDLKIKYYQYVIENFNGAEYDIFKLEAYYNMALTYEDQGKKSKAIEYYKMTMDKTKEYGQSEGFSMIASKRLSKLQKK